MKLLVEPDNPVDECALRVQVPEVAEVHRLHQTGVSSVAGRCVGHVPLKLSRIIAPRMASTQIYNLTVFYTGRIANHGPVRGGGPKLTACYRITLHQYEDFLALLATTGVTSDDVFL